ncbi:TubC N-terminal docking domain-related protein [Humisphaera borealis]|uniref:TubC N-terminal docking domain-containing protein n=1 Tax=Humisphaera borealis TaxID=2807512 RepID=A0A7M2WV56_9BACT|nr:hypothetical protein [Humisphaera borealis]QOV89365.1 hypothetical protein IPV69_24710 [Humisphaera borealis]
MNAVTPDTVEGLLAELDALCIQLHADGDRLCFRPHEAVTADLAARLKTHKAKLLVEVAKRAALDRRMAEQLAQLVPYLTPDGRTVWIHPGHRGWLERHGLL